MKNFTPRAQQVLALARKEADRINHNYVGTEHLLLGMLKLGQGIAVNVLQRLGLDLETGQRKGQMRGAPPFKRVSIISKKKSAACALSSPAEKACPMEPPFHPYKISMKKSGKSAKTFSRNLIQ